MQRVEQFLCDCEGFRIKCSTLAGDSHSLSDQFLKFVHGASEQAVIIVAPAERLSVVARLLQSDSTSSGPPILVVSDQADSRQMIHLLKLGAADFILNPSATADILPRLWSCMERAGHPSPGETAREPQRELDPVIGRSPIFVREMKRAEQASRCDVSVFISGETGTGKEVCARAIHRLSHRDSKPFVPINGGAIPIDLIENELFGHSREAYTGATSSRDGLIAEAEGGTLFIDEVDCFPPAAQVKLLRFLQEKEYRPLGTRRLRNADVRILAATNSDVGRLLDEGRLRSDLYYRLNTISIALPPLRERQEDIMPLAFHFLHKYVESFGAQCRDFSPQARLKLQHHRWPGNVRELEQTVQRAVVLSTDEPTMQAPTIQFDTPQSHQPILSFQEAKAQVVAEFEKNFIENALRAYSGNITRAAEATGKNRRAFWELMRKYRIDADRFRMLDP